MRCNAPSRRSSSGRAPGRSAHSTGQGFLSPPPTLNPFLSLARSRSLYMYIYIHLYLYIYIHAYVHIHIYQWQHTFRTLILG